MHRDTVIGIVGVVILVAAMVGVFTYERGQAASIIGTGGTIAAVAGPGLDGTTALGEATDEILTLNHTGIVNATFTLSWTPGVGVDTLRLTIAPANDTGVTTGATAEEDDGEITLTVPVGNTGPSGTTGVGAWQVKVEFIDARTGLPVEPPIAPPTRTDTQVSWTLATSLDTYTTSA